MRYHKFEKNVPYICRYKNCNVCFYKYSSFESHVTRKHVYYGNNGSHSNMADIFTCRVSQCLFESSFPTDIVSHLKSHIKNGEAVACFFKHCDVSKKIRNYSSYRSHLGRYHPNWKIRPTITAVEIKQYSPSNEPDIVGIEAINTEVSHNQIQILKHLALLYLKLESQNFLNNDTLNTIIKEISEIHFYDIDLCAETMVKVLKENNLDSQLIEQIKQDVLENINRKHSIADNSSLFQSAFKRKKYYKQNFKYVAPKKNHFRS